MTVASAAVRPYLAFMRSALLGMLAYRLRYFTGILTYLLYVSIHYFIWAAVFSSGASEPDKNLVLNGFTLSDMVTYITVAWIARSMCFSNIDWDMEELVKTGQISIYLLRPVNFLGMMLSQAAGELLFRLVFFTVPISIVIYLLFPIAPPAGTAAFALFLITSLLGFLVMAEFNFLVGIAALYFKSIGGLIQSKHYLIQLFSGLLIPLPFFPPWAEVVLKALPFQVITFMPLQFYLGKIAPDQALPALLQAVGWVAALYIMGQLLWQAAISRLSVQGG